MQFPLLRKESPARDSHTILVSLPSPLLSCDLSPFLAVPPFPKLPITAYHILMSVASLVSIPSFPFPVPLPFLFSHIVK